MTALGCGRLDRHEPHEWTRHPHHEGGYGGPVVMVPARTYQCSGHVITEGGHWAVWDAIDDAADERAAREREERAAS